jgi:hypothetical protein
MISMLSLARIPAEDFKKTDLNVTLLVFNLDRTQDRIVDWAAKAGGYFTYRSPDQLILRFPAGKTEEFRKLLESLEEEVNEIRQNTTDLREELLGARSGIKSR